jgi:hypothetical protein
MRNLHPVRPQERLRDHGTFVRPDGSRERWTVHSLAPGRHIVRVDVAGVEGPASRSELWHLMLDESGRPERMQVRLSEGGPPLEATFTFFEDEVLVWRKGGGSASEAIELPPQCRLLWPPVAGREYCLGVGAGAPSSEKQPLPEVPEGDTAMRLFHIAFVPIVEGGVVGRAVEFTARRGPHSIALSADDMPEMRGDIDDQGRLVRWRDGQQQTERVSDDNDE